MPFTVQELENIANSALDFYYAKGKVERQADQSKPLLRDMRAKKKTFPGGKEFITGAVSGETTTTIQGYEHDDTVAYQNPANTKRWQFPWKELHTGISVTLTELKKDGISITDTATGKGESRHSDREMTALANILEEKIVDMDEGRDRGLNLMLWRDGSASAKHFPGIRSFILNNPLSAVTVGGIDQSTNTWWRNRASLSLSVTTPSDLVITNKLQAEMRQLRRYATPKHKAYAGSAFLEAYEKELRSKGNFTMTGWDKGGSIDGSMVDVAFKGVMFEYDPTLDDESLEKYLFILDMNAIEWQYMEGEDGKRHNPARPADQYVMYRAITDTCGLICKRRNTSGVYSIA